MKKMIALAVVFGFLAIPALAWDQAPPQPIQSCQAQAPWGFPQAAKNGAAICRHAYATLNDTTAKIAVWTAYTLTPANALGCIPRSNVFAPDASLPKGQRAELADYAKSGYDMGHVAPDGDMSFDQQAEFESFLLTNMMPQLPGLNRGIWKLLETNVRGWASQTNNTFTVYAGPIYGVGDKTIGPNAVVVPHAFYKVVINDNTREYAAWLFPHAGNQGNDLTKLRVPLSTIQQQTSVQFPVPPGSKELQPGGEWSVDFGKLTAAKRQKCGTTTD